MPQGRHAAPEGCPAPLARRIAALFYEALLLLAILWLAGLVFSLIDLGLGLPHPRFTYQLYLLLVAGAYFVWQWVHGGQTLPMKTWRLKLVTRNGAPLTWPQAWLRYVAALAGLGGIGVGFVWAFFDRDGLFLHDRITGTHIVRV